MDRITLQNYRCFGSEEQSARLAPLTLLVGPNSTGKTSFLALIRALWDVAFREVVPNFREEPYDLGSWDDIVHRRTNREPSSSAFEAGLGLDRARDGTWDPIVFRANFGKHDGSPFPISRTLDDCATRLSLMMSEDRTYALNVRTSNSEYDRRLPHRQGDDPHLYSLFFLSVLSPVQRVTESIERVELDTNEFGPLVLRFWDRKSGVLFSDRLFASAPTRTSPRRTYDPALMARDVAGEYVPSYLANLHRRDSDEWQLLKGGLERFGAASELFDEIQVRSFGRSDGDPFQIQVRKHSGPKSRRRKGPWRNLIDVGYGVSQALPVLTELLRPDGPTMFLLQQPEVHLHPQAQAALGTLFCQTAAAGRQLVIETHSDYIIDRVRMDVRDGTTGLKPEDVSILYFEPGDQAVKIHSIRIDDAGNIKNAPEGYRQFFTDEMMRSIWA